MAELTPQDMAAKLLTTGFERSGPSAAALSDPIADTPMVVTLDQLRPYDHDPRVTRNPAYSEIKASIRERGLDAPPAITRRPGETHYIIRNGGTPGWPSCGNCGARPGRSASSALRACFAHGRRAVRLWR